MLYYDFDKFCAGEVFDESGSGNNGLSRGSVVVEPGYNQDNGVDLSDGFIQLDGMNFKVRCFENLRHISEEKILNLKFGGGYVCQAWLK